jgi:FAS-associated factor 2
MSTPDISQLTSTQQEALQTYTAVTDQDPIAAIPLLQRAEWNVQIAIARFFDGEPTTDPVAEARAQLPSTSARQTSNLQYEALLAGSRPSASRANPEDVVERVDSSTANETHYRPSFLFSLIFTPFNIIYRVLSTVLSPFGFLVPSFLSRLFTRLIYQPSRPIRRPLPPGENTRRFIRELSEEYGENTLPFAETGFNLTLDNAKRDLKFILVVLLSPSHDENHTWVRDTLLSSQFKTFLDSHKDETILWGGNVRDSEAYQVSSSLQCTKFPFAALVCQTTESGSSNMTVIMRAAGPTTAPELVAKLGTAMTTHQAQLGAARAQRAEQQASRSLRQEQDSAYERSLAQDRERARQRREQQEATERAEREARELAQALERKQQNTAQWKQWRAQSLPDEPGVDVKDAIRVSIRMPSGERVIRRFQADADLEELYAFVECYDIAKASDAESPEAREKGVEEPLNYEHQYKFRLVSPMPRTVFELEKGGSVGERIGRGANLIVEPITEDEDEDNSDE